MNASDVLTIARKDVRIALRRRTTVISLVAFPLVVAVGLSLVLQRVVGRQRVPPTLLPALAESFVFFFVIEAAVLPTAIASYALVGEKIERSLEPLLATPVTELDILLGKALAAFAPAVVATWVGAGIFIALTDRYTSGSLGSSHLPDATAWIIILLVIPLSALLSVLLSVLISVRATDVRGAQQAAALIVLPFAAIYVSSEVGLFTLDATRMLWLALGLAVVDVVLFVVARGVFGREEILTRWR